MEVLLHQINTRQRSGGAGAADFASSPALENATKFIRPSKITSQAIASARDSVAKNVDAAQSKVTNSMAFKLKSYVSGVVLDIATWHVKKNHHRLCRKGIVLDLPSHSSVENFRISIQLVVSTKIFAKKTRRCLLRY